MGLFGSKKKTVYTCYATKLFAEMKPVVQQTAVTSITQNRNMAKDLIANITNGILFKANQFYTYAKAGNHPWGLPDGEVTHISPVSTDRVGAVISEEVEGEPVDVTSVNVEKSEAGEYIYEVEYYLLDAKGDYVGDPKVWVYNESLGTYPILDITKSAEVSPYYPITPIRVNNVNLGERPAEGEAAPPDRVDILRAATFLGIDIDQMYDSINEQVEDSGDNPPEDMFIMMGVSVSGQDQRSKEYLFRYFEKMYGESLVQEDAYKKWESDPDQDKLRVPSNIVTIADSTFTQEIEWDYIRRTVHTGKVQEVGEYVTDYSRAQGVVDEGDYLRATAGLLIRYQRTATQYVEYFVSGLVYRNLVVGRSWVSKSLEDAFEDPDGAEDGECFIIPLRKDVCNEIGNIKSHDLMYQAIRLITNDRYTYRVKWYQTGFFQFFILVVAIAVSIFTGVQNGIAVMSWAMVQHVITQVIIQMYLVPLVFQLVEDLVGPELALVAAVVAAAVGVSVGISESGMLAASTSTASASVRAAAVASTAVNGISKLGTSRLLEEADAIQAELEEVQEALDLLAEEDAQRAYDIGVVTSMISSDPYNLMEPSGYVKRFQMEHLEPTFLEKYTENFVAVSQFTDAPYSPIRLGV